MEGDILCMQETTAEKKKKVLYCLVFVVESIGYHLC